MNSSTKKKYSRWADPASQDRYFTRKKNVWYCLGHLSIENHISLFPIYPQAQYLIFYIYLEKEISSHYFYFNI